MLKSSDELQRAALDSYAIAWRHLESREATTACTLFGRALETPILCGGMAHYDKLHEGGAVAFAEGAKAAGTSMWTGMSSDEDHEKLIAVGAPAGRIIKPFADHERVIAHVRHDARCGAAAWAMDIDHVYKKDGSRYDFFGAPLESPTRAVLEAYVNCAPLPFFPKGVVSVRDAVLCAEAGCAGVIISHHQNMFPWTVPPLRALREIRRELGRDFTILIDSDFETGYDVFKALAFGADGVFVARPLVSVFREKGAEGVAEHIRSMTDELRCCLARTASPDIRHIDPDVIVKL